MGYANHETALMFPIVPECVIAFVVNKGGIC